MPLTDAKLRDLTTPGKHADGGGLYLHITQAGGRYWRLKYRFAGKEKLLALGVYPEVSLKEARERRAVARQALERGDDPGELRKAAKAKVMHEAADTLKAVADDWLAHQAGRWDPVTLARTRASLEADVFPALGAVPMASVTTRQVMDVVKKIEKRGAAEIAMRVLQRIKAIYRYGVTHQRIEHNPMLDLVPSEILKPRRVQHRAGLPAGARETDAVVGPTTSTGAGPVRWCLSSPAPPDIRSSPAALWCCDHASRAGAMRCKGILGWRPRRSRQPKIFLEKNHLS